MIDAVDAHLGSPLDNAWHEMDFVLTLEHIATRADAREVLGALDLARVFVRRAYGDLEPWPQPLLRALSRLCLQAQAHHAFTPLLLAHYARAVDAQECAVDVHFFRLVQRERERIRALGLSRCALVVLMSQFAPHTTSREVRPCEFSECVQALIDDIYVDGEDAVARVGELYLECFDTT
jgi:hypothetical protein